jgi:hypothetical protein
MIPRLQTEGAECMRLATRLLQTSNEAVHSSVSFVIYNMKGGKHAAW